MRTQATRARDAALRRLSHINRWLIAGSVVLTGVLYEVAAQAFPGKTLRAGSSSDAKSTGGHRASQGSGAKSSTCSAGSLQPPCQAPQASPERESAEEPSSGQAPSSGESPASREGSPSQESAPSLQSPSTSQAAPGREPAPANEATPPVVSGGS
jgi:hypothetical protein